VSTGGGGKYEGGVETLFGLSSLLQTAGRLPDFDLKIKFQTVTPHHTGGRGRFLKGPFKIFEGRE